jgi:O-antigen ligase
MQLLVVTYRSSGSHLAPAVWAGGLGLALIGIRMRRGVAPALRLPWLDMILAALLGWILVAFLLSPIPLLSLADSWAWVSAIGLALVLPGLPRAEARFALLAICILAPGLHALGIGIVVGWLDLAPDPGLDANILALRSVLVLFLLPALALATDSRARPGWLLSGPLLLAAGAVIGALIQDVFQSRAGIVIGGAGLIVLAPVLPRSATWVLAGFGLGVIGILLGGDAVGVGGEGVVLSEHQVTSRGSMLSAAIHLIGQSPLLGAGFGAFSVLYPPLRVPGDMTVGDMVHNEYLQLWLEGGLPMGLFLVGLLLVSFFAGVSLLHRHLAEPSDENAARVRERAWALTALLMAGAILVHATINFPLHDPATLSVLLVSATLGIRHRFGADSRIAKAPRRVPAGPGLAVLAAFWLYSALIAGSYVVLARTTPLPFVGPVEFSTETRYALAVQLDRFGIGADLPASQLGDAAAQVRRLDPGAAPPQVGQIAVARYRQAIDASPYHIGHYVKLAGLLRETGLGTAQERIEVLERGLRQDPYDARLWWALAFEYRQIGEWEQQAARRLDAWLPRCRFMHLDRPRELAEFLALVPEDLKARHADAIGECTAPR